MLNTIKSLWGRLFGQRTPAQPATQEVVSDVAPGAAAIHRWGVNGEGWTYHPSFEGKFMELLKLLKAESENRQDLPADGCRAYQVNWLYGTLFVVHYRDLECPDPKAAGRNPSILVAANVGDLLAADIATLLSKIAGRDGPTLLTKTANCVGSNPLCHISMEG